MFIARLYYVFDAAARKARPDDADVPA